MKNQKQPMDMELEMLVVPEASAAKEAGWLLSNLSRL